MKQGILSRWKESLHFFSIDMLKKEAFLWWRHLQLAARALVSSWVLMLTFVVTLVLIVQIEDILAYLYEHKVQWVLALSETWSQFFVPFLVRRGMRVDEAFTLINIPFWVEDFLNSVVLMPLLLILSRPSVLPKQEVFKKTFLFKGLGIGLLLFVLWAFAELFPLWFTLSFQPPYSQLSTFLTTLLFKILLILPLYGVFVGFFIFDATCAIDWLRAFGRAAKMLWFNLPVTLVLALMSLRGGVLWGLVVLLYGVFYSLWTVKNYETYFETEE
ncbi:MAG: hypothetical protein UV38_C0001G0283 [candidate division TM6 bacterium GW2011_GWE2_42_60]|nr:MAG: hypothetical protein UV38_C0001G0283 [candidate division TM6 bacterium GW2011_GWE2_42_60]HBY05524.1 hypothetical protein [Candidatus Dependentiae bacterium]